MGECTIKLTKQSDFGDRAHLLDIGPTWPEQIDREHDDPASVVNGGKGSLTGNPEIKR